MNEIVSSILAAEKEAEEKIIKAEETAKNNALQAEVDAEKIKEDAIENFKLLRKEKILSAINKAEEEYSLKVKKGQEIANQLAGEATKKVDAVAIDIVKEILG